MHRWKYSLVTLLTAVLMLHTAGHAAHQQAAGTLDPAAIRVPDTAGHIISSHPSTAASQAAPKTIIHIQDAHANYQAQKHLAAIVDALAKTYGIQLVLVEGGVDNASLSYLRRYATPEKRQQVAEEFLKAGEISGEEYLDITVED